MANKKTKKTEESSLQFSEERLNHVDLTLTSYSFAEEGNL